MENTFGGGKQCYAGCLGGGTCVYACVYGAMAMTVDGLPEIDHKKCTACGLCVTACPRKLLRVLPRDRLVYVKCSSHDRGPLVRKACRVGCIACGICVKVCPEAAIILTDFLASIDFSKCTSCGQCVEKCPTKCIIHQLEDY